MEDFMSTVCINPQRIFFIFMYRRKVRGREEGRPGLRLPRGGGRKGGGRGEEGGRGRGAIFFFPD
jgi:hypothetical protein